MPKQITLTYGAAFLLANLFSGLVNAAGDIMINNAWIRSAPPSASALAGYMDIQNHSKKTITLSSASSPQFERVEVHRSTTHNGMMHMEAVENFSINGHDSVSLKPGDYHLMLINPKQPLNRGDQASFKFTFGEESVSVNAVVKDSAEEGKEDNGVGHHHH